MFCVDPKEVMKAAAIAASGVHLRPNNVAILVGNGIAVRFSSNGDVTIGIIVNGDFFPTRTISIEQINAAIREQEPIPSA